jgi:hypothetical protein
LFEKLRHEIDRLRKENKDLRNHLPQMVPPPVNGFILGARNPDANPEDKKGILERIAFLFLRIGKFSTSLDRS